MAQRIGFSYCGSYHVQLRAIVVIPEKFRRLACSAYKYVIAY
jgi:hypothetical protein